MRHASLNLNTHAHDANIDAHACSRAHDRCRSPRDRRPCEKHPQREAFESEPSALPDRRGGDSGTIASAISSVRRARIAQLREELIEAFVHKADRLLAPAA